MADEYENVLSDILPYLKRARDMWQFLNVETALPTVYKGDLIMPRIPQRNYSGSFRRTGIGYECELTDSGTFFMNKIGYSSIIFDNIIVLNKEKKEVDGWQIFDEPPGSNVKEPLIITELRHCKSPEVDNICRLFSEAMYREWELSVAESEKYEKTEDDFPKLLYGKITRQTRLS